VLALLVGVGGAAGTFAGGWFADRLSKRNPGWRAWVMVVTNAVTLPLVVAAFTSESAAATIWFYILPAVLGGAYIGPGFAIIQSAIPLESVHPQHHRPRPGAILRWRDQRPVRRQ
jgi:predicted MFS family arabinose efflux permease